MAKERNLECKTLGEHPLWKFTDRINRNGFYTFQSGELIIEIQKGSGIIKTSQHKMEYLGVNEFINGISLIAQPTDQYSFEGHLDEDVFFSQLPKQRKAGFIVPNQTRTIIRRCKPLVSGPEKVYYERTMQGNDVLNPEISNLLRDKIEANTISEEFYAAHNIIKLVLDGFLEAFSDPELKLIYKSFFK